MKICTPSMAICAPDWTAESKPISDDKSASAPSIPPAMLRSRCPARISFKLAPVTQEWNPISGFRYTLWHDDMHYDYTDHRDEYSYELDTKKVLNSEGEYYVVHRLIRSSLEGKLVEMSVHCPHDNTSCACNCINDPSFKAAITNSRSEVMDNYIKEREEMRKELKRGLADALRRLAEAERRASESERKLAEAEQRFGLRIGSLRVLRIRPRVGQLSIKLIKMNHS